MTLLPTLRSLLLLGGGLVAAGGAAAVVAQIAMVQGWVFGVTADEASNAAASQPAPPRPTLPPSGLPASSLAAAVPATAPAPVPPALARSFAASLAALTGVPPHAGLPGQHSGPARLPLSRAEAVPRAEPVPRVERVVLPLPAPRTVPVGHGARAASHPGAKLRWVEAHPRAHGSVRLAAGPRVVHPAPSYASQSYAPPAYPAAYPEYALPAGDAMANTPGWAPGWPPGWAPGPRAWPRAATYGYYGDD